MNGIKPCVVRVMATPAGGGKPRERWLNLAMAAWVDRETRTQQGTTVAYAQVAYPVPAGLVCGLTTVDVAPGPDSQKVFTLMETLTAQHPMGPHLFHEDDMQALRDAGFGDPAAA